MSALLAILARQTSKECHLHKRPVGRGKKCARQKPPLGTLGLFGAVVAFTAALFTGGGLSKRSYCQVS